MRLCDTSSIENNTGIESKSFSMEQTPHFFKILSSSLYEDKVKAVLRELSANALDAHTDAGKQDVPIQISLPNDLSPELVVSDFGKGMSLDTLEHIYTSYGASTKTHSNDAIGGFGMGSKSPFALTQSFTVESTHEGITTHVACYLDEGMPKFSVFSSTHTGNDSGTTVRVPVSDSKHIQNFIYTSSTLFTLWETPPEIKGARVENALKDAKIHEQDSYLALDRYTSIQRGYHFNRYGESSVHYISIGPFVYRIPDTLISELKEEKAYQQICKFKVNGEHLQFILKSSIGDLELAPSRERIEATEKNKEQILIKLESIVAEVTEANKDITPEDVFYEAVKYIENNATTKDSYPTLKNTMSTPYYLNIDSEKFNTFLHNYIGCQDNPIALDYHFRSLQDEVSIIKTLSAKKEKSKILKIADIAAKLPSCFFRTYCFGDQTRDPIFSLFSHKNTQNHYGIEHLNNSLTIHLPFLDRIRTSEKDHVSQAFLNTYNILHPIKTKTTYRHDRLSKFQNYQLLGTKQFIILKGYKKSSTTAKINKLFRQDILPYDDDTVVIYTDDLDPKIFVEDIKKFPLRTEEKDRSFYFQSDIDKLAKQIKKTSNTKASVDRVKKQNNIVGQQYLLDSSGKDISELDLYETDLLTNYDYFVYSTAQGLFSFPRLYSKLFEKDIFSRVFFFSPKSNKELSTKRFKTLLDYANKQGIKVLNEATNNHTVTFERILTELIKTNPKTFTPYVKKAVEAYTANEYIDFVENDFTIYSNELKKALSFDLYNVKTEGSSFPAMRLVYDKLITQKLKHFIRKELKESLYVKYAGYVFLAYRDTESTGPKCKPEEVFTKQELKKLTSTFHKTIKKAGKLYDSSFENIHGIDSNTL